jgi:hypothetical protein
MTFWPPINRIFFAITSIGTSDFMQSPNQDGGYTIQDTGGNQLIRIINYDPDKPGNPFSNSL